MSTDRRMDKEEVVHIHSGMLLSHEESESVLVKWMNLKPVIPSEVCQKKKKKYHILTHVYGI